VNQISISAKLCIVIPLLLFLSRYGYTQERKDIGIQSGGTYYIGDYNIGTPLYQPSPGFGLMYRYNINKYNALRLSANYGGLKGSYSSSHHYLPGVTGSFSKQLLELDGLYEVNFMSFNTKHLNKDNFTPYVVMGLGIAYIGGEIIPHFPFGVGLKYCPAPRITVGCEWRLSKTFSDSIDDYQNVYDGNKAFLHNNDWFSFAGLFITFRLYNYKNTCPVYK
jgi:hypothetical protein